LEDGFLGQLEQEDMNQSQGVMINQEVDMGHHQHLLVDNQLSQEHFLQEVVVGGTLVGHPA